MDITKEELRQIIQDEVTKVFSIFLKDINFMNLIDTPEVAETNVMKFINKDYIKNQNEYVLMSRLYPYYKTFCNENNINASTKSLFIKELVANGIKINRLNIGNVAYLKEK